MKSAKRKLEQKIADKVVESLSEELARRAFKPIEQAMDSVMRERYKDSINNGQEVDWEKMNASYMDFLNDMNKSVELPESYHFDVTQEVEFIDYDKNKKLIKLYYSKMDSILGMETVEEKHTTQLVLMDMSRDAIVLYTTEKNGKKTAQAIPSVMKLASAMASSAPKDETKYTITKTGKTKKIAGYNTEEYNGESEEEYATLYITKDFPVDIKNNFATYMKQFAPASYNDNIKDVGEGIMLQYENKSKAEPDKKTTWITKKVRTEGIDIVNSEYGFDNK